MSREDATHCKPWSSGFQADGIPIGQTPAVVKVVVEALRVRVPSTHVPGLQDGATLEEGLLPIGSSKRQEKALLMNIT